MTKGNVALTPDCAMVAPVLAKLWAVLTVALCWVGLGILVLVALSIIHGVPVTEIGAMTESASASAYFLKEVVLTQVLLTGALCTATRVVGSLIRVGGWGYAAIASFPPAVLVSVIPTVQFIVAG